MSQGFVRFVWFVVKISTLRHYLDIIQTRPPLRRAAAGIPISVKVFQNFELFSYFADKDD